MLTSMQDFVIVITTVTLSLLFVSLLNRCWPSSNRRAHNDLIGWQLSILGTTYAVMMGFMLYTVWTNYGLANVNAEAEANGLVNAFHVAEGLPEPQRTELRKAAQEYADAVVALDWPAMAQNNTTLKSADINQRMWKILLSVKTASPTELIAEDHCISELSDMAAHRRVRLLQCASRLPAVLWWVLLIGGLVTILSSCMFGAGNSFLHGFQVGALSLLISLVLVAIGDIDRPFQGAVHVDDSAFRRAQINMRASQ